jgi:hypothetical protein
MSEFGERRAFARVLLSTPSSWLLAVAEKRRSDMQARGIKALERRREVIGLS